MRSLFLFVVFVLSFNRLPAQFVRFQPISAVGSYFGTFTNGDAFCVVVSKRNDAVMYIIGRSNNTYGTAFFSLTPNSTGWSFTTTNDGTTLNGAIVGSTISGSVPSRATNFSGALAPRGGSAGYFFGTANDSLGRLYTIAIVVSGDGRVLYYLRGAAGDEGGTGRMISASEFTVVDARNVNGFGNLDLLNESSVALGYITKSPLGRIFYFASRKNAPYRMINIATRGIAGTGASALIAGFVIKGGAKTVLIRAVGPTLALFGVDGVVTDPVLTLFSSRQTVIATNDNWGTSLEAASIPAVSESVGAFPLITASRDSVILVSLEPGSYTAQVESRDARQGIALVEVYEVK